MIRLPIDRPPTHPGEMLLKEFLEPLGMTQTELAKRIHVPIKRVNQIVKKKRSVTPDTALRFAKLFGTTPEFWLDGQLAWDLWHAMHAPAAEDLDKIEPIDDAA